MAIVIPWDSWHEILVRLPAKSLLRCRAVSKAWRAFIDDGCFAKAYTKRQLTYNTNKNAIIRNSAGPPYHPLCSLNLDALNFDGSNLQTVPVTPLDSTQRDGLNFPVAACDGLMLIAPSKPEQKWQIRNPSTHESLDLPQFDLLKYHDVATGLGYDKSTDDYKAVVIDRHCRRPGDGESEVRVYRTQIYSLKSDSWRTIADFPGHNMWGPSVPGVYMCGSLNWVNYIPLQNYEKMIALDLGTETYRELRVPSVCKPIYMGQNRYLDVLDSGRLIMTEHSFTYMNKLQNFDVWVMQDYEADDSWVRCFSVEGVSGVARSLSYVAFMEDKLQVLLQDGWGFYLHDVRTSSVRRLVIEGLSEIVSDEKGIHVIVLAQVVPESIFRLHDNCGVGGRKRIVMDKEENVQMMSEKE
ncbi:hypothetical protein CASFOL_040758 [Castilleja foliolosa]|uniref:F-box domain-containing protein n=1 Tax=Castilleja foliolosa TaxID=1961234 RepID=A0ABD3BCU3_9LAMI